MDKRSSTLVSLLFFFQIVAVVANGNSEDIRYELFDDPEAQLGRQEQRILEEWSEDIILFEDFNDREVKDIRDIDTGKIADGVLRIEKDGNHFSYELPSGFTRALVCYRVESENGHQAIREEDFGQPSVSNRDQWIIHELRVVGKELQYVVNGEIFGSVPFDQSMKMRNFSIAANGGGTGVVDYIVIAGRTGPGETLYEFGDAEIVCHDPYVIEAIVPPTPTDSAPFDTVVTPYGGIVMAGSSGSLVEYLRTGEFQRLEIPSGTNFERTRNGTYWYYNFPDGSLRKWTPESRQIVQVAELPKAYTDGSIAVDQDGHVVYIAWWIRDNNPDLESSALYRYTELRGLEKIFDMPKGVFLRAVEVTPSGEVFVATTTGISRVREDGSLTEVFGLRGAHVTSDGLTSDSSGNLYFTAYAGEDTGLFTLDSAWNMRQIAFNPPDRSLPFGLSYNEKTGEIIGVRKEEGELVAMDMEGNIRILNNPTGLTTPIPVKQHPDGDLYVNGDEAGLLRITADGRVERFASGLCSYQPPAADFAFGADGFIYYSEAAPGFPSAVIRIDEKGNHSIISTDLEQPAGIDVASDGAIYYADYGRHAVIRLNLESEDEIAQSDIPFPVGLVIDADGTFWVSAAEKDATGDSDSIVEVSPSRILRFRLGERPEEIIGLGNGIDSTFTFFDVDIDGTLYLPAGHRLLARKNTGEIETAAEGFRNLRGAAVCQDGSIVVTDYGMAALYRIRRR